MLKKAYSEYTDIYPYTKDSMKADYSHTHLLDVGKKRKYRLYSSISNKGVETINNR